jgi:hypothetical protein
MSARLPAPGIDGQLVVADDGGLAFRRATESPRLEFTGGGAPSVIEAQAAEPDVVLAPGDLAELGGRLGWVGGCIRYRVCSFEVELAPAGSAGRAVFRMPKRGPFLPGWASFLTRVPFLIGGWTDAGSTERTSRYDDVWAVYAFVETLQQRRARAGLTPLPFRGVTDESS